MKRDDKQANDTHHHLINVLFDCLITYWLYPRLLSRQLRYNILNTLNQRMYQLI